VVIDRSLPRKTAAFSESIAAVLSVNSVASVNEPAASAVASATAAVTPGSATARRTPVINAAGSRAPTSRHRRSSATAGRVTTARGAMIASSGKHWARKSAWPTLAPACSMPPNRRSLAYEATAAATGRISQGTNRAGERCRDRESTNVRVRSVATPAITANAATVPSKASMIADRIAADSSCSAGPR
jgi:hypothetical protein